MSHRSSKCLAWLQIGGVDIRKVTPISLILVVSVLSLSITSLLQLLHLGISGGSLHSTLLIKKFVTSTVIQSFDGHSLIISESTHNCHFELKKPTSQPIYLPHSLDASHPSVTPTTAFKELNSGDDVALR